MSTIFTTNKSSGFALDGLTVRSLMPHGYPFQMFDKIKSYDHEKGRIIAIKNIAQNDPFIQGHFPGNPIFPGVLIIEALAQAAGCGWIIYDLMEKGIAPENFAAEVKNVMSMATIWLKAKSSTPVLYFLAIRLSWKLSLSFVEPTCAAAKFVQQSTAAKSPKAN